MNTAEVRSTMKAPRPSQTAAEVVLEHPACARVFQRHRIDFACEGEETIADAAAAQGVDLRALIAELESAIERGRIEANRDLRALPTPALVEHLAGQVHRDLRKTLAYVVALSGRVLQTHSGRNHRLRALNETVTRVAAELEAHMWGEEISLFSAIRDGARDRATIESALLGMHDEHVLVHDLLARMRAEADDFRVPRWAGSDYRTLFAELEWLEHDVYRHVHLENHVLLRRFAT
jgi:regulator of cell morphogenesis and NO signaling